MRLGIPTKYRDIQFRSRIEARWAVFFDKCGWKWSYEPVDLGGYIPDFLLHFEHEDVWAEVKAGKPSDDYTSVIEKIWKSGWPGNSIVLCATWDECAALSVRIGRAVFDEEHCYAIGDALLVKCGMCREPAIWHCVDWPMCFRCGSEGRVLDNEFPPEASLEVSVFHLRERWWAEAGNQVQWKKQE